MTTGQLTLAGPLPIARFGRSALAWPDGDPVALDLATALILPYLDGSADLAELIEDAAAVLDVPVGSASVAVQADIDHLTAAGAIRGDTEPSAADTGVGSDLGSEQGEGRIIEVIEDGRQTTTLEQLPDGRFRRTVVASISAANSNDHFRDALSTNALTDMVGGESCVGFKLRAGEPARDLVVDVDGARTRIRVTHPPTLEDLHRTFASAIVHDDTIVKATEDSLATGRQPERETASKAQPKLERDGALEAPAPPASEGASVRAGLGVAAYVIGPLEGDGPPRIYDRWGRRFGRPASASEAVTVVGHLLNDERSAPEGGGMLVHAFPVAVDGGCVLLVDALREGSQLHRELRRNGLEPIDCRRVRLGRDGLVSIEEPWPSEHQRTLPLRGVVGLGATVDPPVVVAQDLLREMLAPGPVAAQRALDLLAEVLASVPVVALASYDHRHVAEVIASMATNR